MENQATAGRSRVDPFLERPQAHAPLRQLAHDIDQVPD
jgi:hypothetical protein